MANEQDGIVWKKGNDNLIYTSDEDAWDDTELIKAYDRAVAQLKEEGSQSVSSNCQATESDKIKKRKKKKKSKNANKKWKVGGQCLAIFSGDGLYYESTILSTNYDDKTLKVKFSYYGNEEEVSMKELLPIESKAEMEVVPNNVNYLDDIEQQSSQDTNTSDDEKHKIQMVTGFHVSDICYVLNKKGTYQKAVVNSITSSDLCHVTIIKSNQKKVVKTSQLHSSLPSKDKRSQHKSRSPQQHSSYIPWPLPDFPTHIPPPPTLLPNSGPPSFPSFSNKFSPWPNCYPNNTDNNFLSSNLPQCPPLPVMPEDVISGNEEALANMLKSWYISGFHTGYYKGMQQNYQHHKNIQHSNQHRDRKKKNTRKRMDKTEVSN